MRDPQQISQTQTDQIGQVQRTGRCGGHRSNRRSNRRADWLLRGGILGCVVMAPLSLADPALSDQVFADQAGLECPEGAGEIPAALCQAVEQALVERHAEGRHADGLAEGLPEGLAVRLIVVQITEDQMRARLDWQRGQACDAQISEWTPEWISGPDLTLAAYDGPLHISQMAQFARDLVAASALPLFDP